MGRLPRIIDDGLVYHAINRGNNRTEVFADDSDHLAFIEAIARAKERYPFRLFGYCLMTDHFHLLLRPGDGQSVSRILQSMTVAHTSRYHKRHQTSGHVWQGRFKSPAIQDDVHLLAVLRYIEANPLRAKLVTNLKDYRWSSYRAHGLGEADPLLDPMPEWEELGRTDKERCSRWRRHVALGESEKDLAAIRASAHSGRPFGSEDWVDATAKRLSVELTARPRGRPRKVD
jgi:putative transposase